MFLGLARVCDSTTPKCDNAKSYSNACVYQLATVHKLTPEEVVNAKYKTLKTIWFGLALFLPSIPFAQERGYQQGLRPQAVFETPPVLSPQQVKNDALGVAISKRDVAHVAKFIRAGNDLNFNFNYDKDWQSSSGSSPITKAVTYESLNIVHMLLEAGANVDRIDGFGSAAIHNAGSADMLKLLIKFGADPNFQDASGRTPIVLAVEKGSLAAIDLLIAHGARVDAPFTGNDLFTRAITARKPELIELLLERGVDPRSPPTQALLPLLLNGDVVRAKLLIKRGAYVNTQDTDGQILGRALLSQQWEIVEALLDAGASITWPDSSACANNKSSCPSIQVARLASIHPPTLTKLKAMGLDLNLVSLSGHTALTSLIVEKTFAIQAVPRLRLQMPAVRAIPPQGPNNMAVKPLTKEQHVPYVQDTGPSRVIPAPDNVARARALLALGADPNIKFLKFTPLMLAVSEYGKAEKFADLLLKAGGRIEYDERIPGSLPEPNPFALPADAINSLPLISSGDRSADVHSDQDILKGMRVGPLTWVALHGKPDIALRLLARDRKVEPSDRFLLYFAASAGYWDLLIGALPYTREVNASNRAGVTPLMIAADVGNVDAVRALLTAGAQVNARSARNWPPWLERSLPNEILGALAGHPPRAPKLVGGFTALRAASAKGHIEVASILAEAGGRE